MSATGLCWAVRLLDVQAVAILLRRDRKLAQAIGAFESSAARLDFDCVLLFALICSSRIDDDGNSAINLAALSKKRDVLEAPAKPERILLCALLLAAGADPYVPNDEEDDGRSAIFDCKDPVMRRLIEAACSNTVPEWVTYPPHVCECRCSI